MRHRADVHFREEAVGQIGSQVRVLHAEDGAQRSFTVKGRNATTTQQVLGKTLLEAWSKQRVGCADIKKAPKIGEALSRIFRHERGQPFGGLRENPHFWHWLLSDLRQDLQTWVPPRPIMERGR